MNILGMWNATSAEIEWIANKDSIIVNNANMIFAMVAYHIIKTYQIQSVHWTIPFSI